MTVEEYDVLPDGEFECEECWCREDIVYDDENSRHICTDCLFYEKSMEGL